MYITFNPAKSSHTDAVIPEISSVFRHAAVVIERGWATSHAAYDWDKIEDDAASISYLELGERASS